MTLCEVRDFFSHETEPTKGAETERIARAAFALLDRGEARVWDPETATVNTWVKRAILAGFANFANRPMDAGCFEYFDKIDLKSRAHLEGVRVIPGAMVRAGSYIAPGAILMPCCINVGAYVGAGTMIDTWATVGSCAQVGAHVHVSGGVGLGGVLEPPQAAPVVIEDEAFLGSRCIVVEGVRVRRRAVLGAGVVLTASTPILDVRGPEVREWKKEVPENAIVIPGTRPKQFPAGEYHVPCALIIGTRNPATDRKTSLNQVLREHAIPV